MSLLADLFDAARGPGTVLAPRAETPPPLPFTGTAMVGNVFGRSADPSERTLDLTTAESTLYSVLDLISGDVGSVGWSLYRGERGADMEPPEGARPLTDRQHLAARLWEQPNDFMTGDHLRTVVSWHYDSVGEGWVVCDYAMPGVPLSFWPVRPDRMFPVTDAEKFLTGYVYRGPDGQKVPLRMDEVLRITRPHPKDPHRGIGPVPALALPLNTSLTAQQWIEAFYQNDATPGGMLELGLDELLEDDDWSAYVTRWNEQHRGVSRAHRVGILEVGTFKPVQVDFKKLQVTEMRHLTRDQVLEAFRIHKHMIGASDDVNRAAALAADGTYARRTLKPRVRKWWSFANGPYLRCFGKTGQGVHWCPENVVPEDEDAANTERTSVATAAKTYADAGVPIEQWAAYLGLPFEAGQSGASPTEIAVLVQKLYLGVGELGQPNVLLSTTEGRRILESVGVELDPWEPEPIVIESQRTPPPQLPPGADDDLDELPPGEDEDQ